MSHLKTETLSHWPEPPSDEDLLIRKKRTRHQVLKYFYDQIGDQQYAMLGRYDAVNHFVKNQSMTAAEAEAALDYLEIAGFVKTITIDGDMQLQPRGRREIETVTNQPTQSKKQIIVKGNYNDLRNSKFGGGFANRDQSGGQLQEQPHDSNISEIAVEMQNLLEQFSASQAISSPTEKILVVQEAVHEIEENPSLKRKIANALKAGGSEALKEAIHHPLVNILMATIEGWQETE